MFCSKCHTKLEEKTSYCNHCGKKINSTRKKSEWSSFSSKNKNDYIEAYIGTNWNPNQISFPAAILGPFYLIHRKLIKEAFILIIIYITTHIYLSDNLGILIRLFTNIIIACTINKYYYYKAIKHVEKIKEKNQEKEKKEQLEICKKKGGTTPYSITVISTILYFVMIAITSLEYKAEPIQSKPQTNLQNNEIIYKIPSTAEIKTNHDNYQHIKSNHCYITITSTKTNETEEEYIHSSKKVYIDYKQQEIREKTIKNKKWKILYMKKSDSYQEIYISKINHSIIEISFRYSKEKECEEEIDYILNNTTIKKNN